MLNGYDYSPCTVIYVSVLSRVDSMKIAETHDMTKDRVSVSVSEPVHFPRSVPIFHILKKKSVSTVILSSSLIWDRGTK